MNIFCPHCDTQIEFLAESSVATTSCPECGKVIENVALPDTVNRTINPGEATDVGSPALATTFVPHRTSTDSSLTDFIEFGDYEILHEIARGGMGVVYKARQKSLNRIVALKMILSGHLASKKDIKRFHSEAEAAAGLDHPNIVPVYEVGEIDNQHFFSMGFVEGKSLGHKLVDGPLPPREAAALTKTITEAVEYSHQKGIVHRDLKPGNVLIDENGQPKVTDFGLAKQIDADSSATATGQILGTPNYMSPEQAAGNIDEVGPSSDLYSLGAILYCLLTGRPPFQAANVLDTLKQVVEQEPVSPRFLNPTVDQDMETICLKCLEKEPAKRYRSAQELTEELERFLKGLPILARPVGRVSRFTRWTKRNPIIAGLSGTVAVVLLVGTIVSTYFAVEANAAVADLNLTLADLEIEKEQSDWNAERATKNAKESGDAVKKFVQTVKNAKLLKEERFKPLLKDLLKDAKVFYQGFVEDPESHEPAEVANALFEIAWISNESGDAMTAIDAYRQSINIREKLVEEYPTVTAYQGRLAGSHNNIGLLYSKTGKPDEALVSYNKALVIQEMLVEDNPTVTEYQNKLAGSHNNIGLLYSKTRKLEEALVSYNKALVIQGKLVEDNPTVTEYQDRLADSHNHIGLLYSETGKLDEALVSHNKALVIREKLVEENPTMTDYQNGLSISHNNIGLLYSKTGKPDEALVSYNKALVIQEMLVEDNPTVTEYQDKLAGSHNNIGLLYSKTGKLEEALVSHNKALVIREKLVEENPTMTDYQNGLSISHNGIGLLYSKTGKLDEALVSYNKALVIMEMLVENNPTVTVYQSGLSTSHSIIGFLHQSTGKPDEALVSYKKTIAIREKLVEKNPSMIDMAIDLGGSYVNIAIFERLQKNHETSAKFFDLGVKTLGKVVESNPRHPKARFFLRNAHYGRAQLMEKMERFPEAISDWEKAFEFATKKFKPFFKKSRDAAAAKAKLQKRKRSQTNPLIAPRPKLRVSKTSGANRGKPLIAPRPKLVEGNPFKFEIAISLGGNYVNKAHLAFDQKDYESAAKFYDLGMKRLEKVVTSNPRHPTARKFLRNAHWGRARLMGELKHFDEAVADWEKAIGYDSGNMKSRLRKSRDAAAAKAKLQKQKRRQEIPLITPRPKIVGAKN